MALVISTPHRGAEPHEGGHTVHAHGCVSGARKRAQDVRDTHKQSRERMTLMPVLGYTPCPSPHSIQMVPEGAVMAPGRDLIPQTADRFRIKHLTRAGSIDSLPCATESRKGEGGTDRAGGGGRPSWQLRSGTRAPPRLRAASQPQDGNGRPRGERGSGSGAFGLLVLACVLTPFLLLDLTRRPCILNLDSLP